MKKTVILLLTSLLLLGVMTGCGNDMNNSATHPGTENNEVTNGATITGSGDKNIMDDIKDGANDIKNDIKDGAEDVKNGIKDTVDDVTDDKNNSRNNSR